MKPFLCLFMFLLLTGCATSRSVDEHVDFNLADQITVYRDQWVRRSPPEVQIQPIRQASYAPKVLFIPFRVTQEMEKPKLAGYAAARTVWQTWLTMQLFPIMEFSGSDTPYRRDMAVAQARQRGVDLVVGGFVTYLYAGGTSGDTQISLQIEAIDVASGQTVWALSQSALLPVQAKKDYFLFAVKHRMPSDPLFAVTKAVAIDTGKIIQNWMSPSSSSQTELQKLDTRVQKTFFSEETVPTPRPIGKGENDSSF